jgi:DNA-binding FrmR family transcriptional regulator
MIEEDKYCLDIVHQSRAVQKALKKLDEKIIEDHLENCVVDQIKSGDEEKTKDELLILFDYK